MISAIDAAVVEHLVFGLASRQSPRLSSAGVVAERGGELGFGARLRRVAARCRRSSRTGVRVGERGARFVHRQLEHRTKEADCRIANRELRRVHADGNAARAGVDVVAREPALAPLVELARLR